MSKQSPLAVVKAKYESKDKLAAHLASLMDIPEGQTREQFQKVLKALSNQKLLKLKRVEDAFIKHFGGKTENAVAAVVAKRKLVGAAVDAFKETAMGYSRARLLDLASPKARS